MKEIWKPIAGFDNSYMVSNLGRVKSLDRIISCCNGSKQSIKGKIMKPWVDDVGYNFLLIGNKRYLIHRLVAQAFLDDFSEEKQVHHINEDKSDNRAENLVCMSMRKHQALHKTIYPKTKICEVCGKEFTPAPSKRKRAKTCSYECWKKICTEKSFARKRPIKQLDLDGNLIKEWTSARDIQNETGYYESNINKCCNGHINTYKGYVWRYA